MNAAEQLSRWHKLLLGYGWRAGWTTSSACLAVADEIAAALAASVSGEEPPAWQDVCAERQRQVSAEGWTPEHDDMHGYGELARASACYALGKKSLRALEWSPDIILWPWENAAWKYDKPRRSLVKSAALALAAIECIDRSSKDADDWTWGELSAAVPTTLRQPEAAAPTFQQGYDKGISECAALGWKTPEPADSSGAGRLAVSEDTKRLDWLESQPHSGLRIEYEGSVGGHLIESWDDQSLGRGATIRAAIDAARAAAEGGQA